jgi:hypothetical protein
MILFKKAFNNFKQYILSNLDKFYLECCHLIHKKGHRLNKF